MFALTHLPEGVFRLSQQKFTYTKLTESPSRVAGRSAAANLPPPGGPPGPRNPLRKVKKTSAGRIDSPPPLNADRLAAQLHTGGQVEIMCDASCTSSSVLDGSVPSDAAYNRAHTCMATCSQSKLTIWEWGGQGAGSGGPTWDRIASWDTGRSKLTKVSPFLSANPCCSVIAYAGYCHRQLWGPERLAAGAGIVLPKNQAEPHFACAYCVVPHIVPARLCRWRGRPPSMAA